MREGDRGSEAERVFRGVGVLGDEGLCVPDPLAARRARYGRSFALIWLVYVAYPLVDLLSPHTPMLKRVMGLAALAIFIAVYVWGWSGEGGWADRRVPRALGALFALSVLTSAYMGPAWVGLFVFASPLAARLGSVRAAVAAVLLNTAVCAAAMVALHFPLAEVLTLGGTCGLAGVAMLGARRLAVTATDLRAAREEIARLAAVEERLRIARDVHDLLGHSLSVIALKADLAGRLLPGDAGRAAAELADIQVVARRSLTEVREAVAGYRRLRLDEELLRARTGLEAAGIDCASARTAGEIPEAADGVLAWVVREASTNVLKHSGARSCRIRVERGQDRIAVSVEDDGRGPTPGPGSGTGLAGLAERVRSVGGDLHAGPGDQGGFRVTAWVWAAGLTAEEARTAEPARRDQ